MFVETGSDSEIIDCAVIVAFIDDWTEQSPLQKYSFFSQPRDRLSSGSEDDAPTGPISLCQPLINSRDGVGSKCHWAIILDILANEQQFNCRSVVRYCKLLIQLLERLTSLNFEDVRVTTSSGLDIKRSGAVYNAYHAGGSFPSTTRLLPYLSTPLQLFLNMRSFTVISVLAGAVASVLGQTIELGTPTDGQVLYPGQNFTAQVILPISMASCIQVGIAFAVASCDNGVCPQPTDRLGNVLYAGPWTPTIPDSDGFYQNFTLQVADYMTAGPAIFTLTHLCLLGGGPIPLLEFRNVSVTIV
ncbi:hypothetical protein J3R82DRAFT_4804 [Butyriboletus roseoflavus]|nr:hypothetical protein J3R82DRAFT_4804 [Butyriboletus roseoflavus]